MDALTLNYWLSKFVQEVAKCSKDPYLPKTLYQIVCGIRRFMVEKNPAIEFNPSDSSDKRCVNWHYWRGRSFDILKLKEIASNFSLFLISVDYSSESVSRKVEKVSQNVDMDTMPVCFVDFKKCAVDFNFNWLELVSFIIWNVFPGHCLLKINDLCSAAFE